MNIANFLSSIRLFFLPFFIIFLLYYSPDKEYLRTFALILALLCFLSDALDGYFARKKGLKTSTGAFLDPLGDKLLINSGFLVLILKPEFKSLNLPLWVVGVVLVRDIFLALGSFILHLRTKLDIRPSYMGKSAVVLQMVSIISALLYFKFSFYIWYLTGVITILAGIGYLLRETPKFFR